MSSSGRSTRSACQQKAAANADSGQHRPDDRRRDEAAVFGELAEAVYERAGGGGHQRQPQHVKAPGAAGVGVRQDPPAHHEGEHADGHVDQEDPRPVQVLEDHSTEDGAEDRREHCRHGHDPHHPPHALGAGNLGHHQLTYWHDHAAAHALQHAEQHQRGGRGGHSAQCRSGSEQHQRDHVHALGSITPRGPAGDRDHGRQRQQIAGDHPLHARDRAVQVAAKGVQRHVDDRGVQDRHDHPQDHHAGDLPHVRVDTVRRSGVEVLGCGLRRHLVPKV